MASSGTRLLSVLPVKVQASDTLDEPEGGREDAEDAGKDMVSVEDLDHVDQTSRTTT